jgi:imidazolonepropionase-like amidohydrolase
MPAAAQGISRPPPLEILHGFTLIDGLGGAPVPDAALAVRGSTIVDAGARASVIARAPAGEAPLFVDLGGGYVVPGLIDAHVHLATAPDRPAAVAELGRLLRHGITAVRDMAGDARLLVHLALETRTGRVRGPDIHFAAVFAGPSFFEDPRARASAGGLAPGSAPWLQSVTEGTDLALAVARARGTSATGLKIYADLNADLVRRITEEAHRQSFPVWSHATVYPARPLDVVLSGVDVVSHACPIAWEAIAGVPERYHHPAPPGFDLVSADAPVFERLLREMASRGTILDATLAMHTLIEGGIPEGSGPVPVGAPAACDRDFARTLVRRAHALGVAVAAGTDFTTPAPEAPALFLELEALVEYGGMTPLEALGAATRVAARALGQAERIGTLQAGTELTFVLLDQDPSVNVRHLRSVREVWKNAARYRVGVEGDLVP